MFDSWKYYNPVQNILQYPKSSLKKLEKMRNLISICRIATMIFCPFHNFRYSLYVISTSTLIYSTLARSRSRKNPLHLFGKK